METREKVMTFINKLHWGNDDEINKVISNGYSVKLLSNVVTESNGDTYLVSTVVFIEN